MKYPHLKMSTEKMSLFQDWSTCFLYFSWQLQMKVQGKGDAPLFVVIYFTVNLLNFSSQVFSSYWALSETSVIHILSKWRRSPQGVVDKTLRQSRESHNTINRDRGWSYSQGAPLSKNSINRDVGTWDLVSSNVWCSQVIYRPLT